MPGRCSVAPHVRGQRAAVVELLLLADEGVERDLDPLTVKVAVEIEQMRLEELARRLEGWPDAEAGDARQLAPVLQRHAHRVNAVPGPLVIAEFEVRGRVAKLTPAFVASLDHAFDREIARQQPC